MRNYFEWEDGSLVVFDKVSKINIKEDIIEIYTNAGEYRTLKLDNYIEQLADYKHWLALKQQALVNQANNSALKTIKEMQVSKQSDGTEIPEIKWLICCWESVYGRKFESLTVDEIEDFLHDCLGILDYAGALNNKNRGTLNDKKPEITPELIDFLADEFTMDSPCSVCKYNIDDKYECDECDFIPDAEKFVKLNKKWQES